jgi:hypothetical protein
MSSAVDTVRSDIESAVSLAWAGQTAIQWTGRPFTVPASGTWLRVTILMGDGFPMTFGGSGVGQNRLVGVVDGALFCKKGDGVGAIVSYADDFRNAVNEQTTGSVRFGVCSGPVEIASQHGYAHLAVTAPFEVIETV